MDEQDATIGGLFGRTWFLVIETMPAAPVALAILTGVGASADFLPGGAGLNIVYSIAGVFAAYVLTVKALRASNFIEDGKPRRGVGAIFILGILTGLGSLLGLVLLVVPGLVIFVRWSLALPILLSEDVGIPEAIGISWEATAGRFWTTGGFLLLIYVPMLLAIAVYAWSEAGLTLPVAVSANGLLVTAQIAGWYAAVALYSSFRTTPRMEEVFA